MMWMLLLPDLAKVLEDVDGFLAAVTWDLYAEQLSCIRRVRRIMRWMDVLCTQANIKPAQICARLGGRLVALL